MPTKPSKFSYYCLVVRLNFFKKKYGVGKCFNRLRFTYILVDGKRNMVLKKLFSVYIVFFFFYLIRSHIPCCLFWMWRTKWYLSVTAVRRVQRSGELLSETICWNERRTRARKGWLRCLKWRKAVKTMSNTHIVCLLLTDVGLLLVFFFLLLG